jgi:hypothetical protein
VNEKETEQVTANDKYILRNNLYSFLAAMTTVQDQEKAITSNQEVIL